MAEQNREVEQAVSALTTEIMKLAGLVSPERDDVCVTIENALLRLSLAILAQTKQTQEECLQEAMTG